MGVVARQSFKAAIVTYIGVLMGIVNNLLIYPYVLSVEQYGEVQFILQSSTFFTPFLLLGLTAVLTRYYPQYKDQSDRKQRFYAMVFGMVSLNTLLFLGLFLIFKDQVAEYYQEKGGVSHNSIYVLIAISALLPFQNLARSYAANQGRIAIPSLFNQLLKFALPLLVILYYYHILSFMDLVRGLFIFNLLLTILNMVYISRLDPFRPKLSMADLRQDPLVRPMLIFAFFSVLGGIGATLTNQVDILMITSMKGTYQTGLYSWALFIANAIAIPFTLISTISMPLIAEYWSRDDISALDRIYKQSSSSMLVLSLGIFLAFWLVVEDVFALMPKGNEFALAKWVILLLCSTKILDMAAGLNNQIIMMSPYYKYNLYFLAAAVLLNIGLNLMFIPPYGIEGSGVATLISIGVFNVLKFTFLQRRFGLQPLDWKSGLSVLLAVLVYALIDLLPRSGRPLLDMIIFSLAGGLLYFGAAYVAKLAPELNNFADKQLSRLGLIRKD